MTGRKRIPLGFGLRRGRSTVAGMSGLVNLYSEPQTYEGRTRIVLYPMPVRTLFSTIGGGDVRGQIDIGNTHYAVVGTSLYSVGADGTPSNLGTIEGEERVDMDFNGSQVVIVAELKSYAWSPTALTLTEFTDPDFGLATSTASVNGYSLFTVPDEDRFIWAEIGDATDIDALSFASADTYGDFNVAVRVAKKDVWIFGKKSVEWFYNSGNPDQAFESKSIAPLEIGCLARDSIVLADTGFIWLGRDGQSGGVGVYRAGGYQATKVSTPAVDRYLEEYATPEDAYALAFQYQGHLFYVLTLPGSITLALDIATGEWSYLHSGPYSMNEEVSGTWDAVTFSVNGANRIVGAADGNLYKLDGTTFVDASGDNIREVTCSQLSYGGFGAIMHRLELDLEVGVGLISGQGSDPIVMASWSKDGGKTWSSPRNATMGQMGEYRKRAFWTMIGQFRHLIVRFRVSDPVMVAMLDAYADIEPMNS